MPVFAARGTRDFLPAEMRAREHVLGIVRRTFELHGFQPLETPAIERVETLAGQYGEEGEKLTFRILERGEGGREGKADLALRYDLTVPLARVVAMNPSLPLPFKRYQVQPVWRAERPQKGRFREFLQCDCDIVGAPGRLADAECVAVAHAAIEALGFSEGFELLVNHRELLRAVVADAGLAEQEHQVLVSVDKWDKLGGPGVGEDLSKHGIDGTRLLARLAHAHDLDAFAELAPGPVAELREVIAHAAALGATRVTFDATLARGLGYYTGPCWETRITDGGVGSVSGGGRYDGLIGRLGGREVPAVGVSLGIERLLVVMGERGMLPAGVGGARAMLTVFSAETSGATLALAARLRKAGVSIETWLGEPGALGKQLKNAAARGVPFAVVMGPDEIARGAVQLKELRTGVQERVPMDQLAGALAEPGP
jgi:histidyl-tRNA synthetase